MPLAAYSSEAHHPKSIFASRTFWGALLTAIAAVTLAVGECVAEYQRTGQVDAHRVANTIVILATTGLTIVGRVGATDAVYTPRGIPGPDRPR